MPTLSRPHFEPSYGIPDTEPEGASWPATEEKLAASRNYWVCTTRADRRPHAKPVWGLWMDGALWFGTGDASVTGRNLARDPRVSVHLESGDDTVILEGTVERITGKGVPASLLATYGAKYDMKQEDIQDEPWLRLAPRIAMTWLEHDFLKTAAHWTFE